MSAILRGIVYIITAIAVAVAPKELSTIIPAGLATAGFLGMTYRDNFYEKSNFIELLKESSTWRGLIMFLTGTGMVISTNDQEIIMTIGIGLAGLMGTFLRDGLGHMVFDISELLKENSTWRGIAFVATASGIVISPENQELLISIGLGISGLLSQLNIKST